MDMFKLSLLHLLFHTNHLTFHLVRILLTFINFGVLGL